MYDPESGQFTVIDYPASKYPPDIILKKIPPHTPGHTSLPISPHTSGFPEIDLIFTGFKNLPVPGHVYDAYAYLRGLYQIASNLSSGSEKAALQDFVINNMTLLKEQVQSYSKLSVNLHPPWNASDRMTVATIMTSFQEACSKETSPLQSYLETYQPSATASRSVTTPVGTDIVLKQISAHKVSTSFWARLLRALFPRSAEVKKALSSESTLWDYSNDYARRAGWQVVADAKSIQDKGFQEERLRLARVLVVAEVNQQLIEDQSNRSVLPGQSPEDIDTTIQSKIDTIIGEKCKEYLPRCAEEFQGKLAPYKDQIATTVKKLSSLSATAPDNPEENTHLDFSQILHNLPPTLPCSHNRLPKQ